MRKKYQRISVSSGEENIDESFAFLMDILKRPSLGNYVRHVECCKSIYEYGHIDYKEVKSQRDLSNEEMNLVRNAVRKGGFKGTQEDRVVNMLMQRMEKTAALAYRYRESIGTFIAQALTAILIVVSPNLVSMAMTPPCRLSSKRVIDFPLAELLHQANASPESMPYLRNLRNVYLINKNDDSESRFYLPMEFSGCLRLFDNLLSIESVRVDIMEEDGNEKLAFKEKCSNITKISIHHSSLGSLYLTNLIWSCRVLREFQYSTGGRASIEGGSPMFNPKAFIKVLCAHKKTLEILDVNTGDGVYAFDIVDEEERDHRFNHHGGPFEYHISDETCTFYKLIWTYGGSLKEFVALKRLSLDINVMLYFAAGVSGEPYKKGTKLDLVDCLPVGLEYLCVRGYQKGENEEHDKQMDALMVFYKSGSSQLTEVKGIDELIPNAEVVQDPDEDDHLLWSLEEMGYESD
ncbi:uncharacterized protein N7479_002889 [Penicillium vulpinum]|nr:uncharacterized protein N7479_002889 [Penicillium vulpinum]KAJ5972971.1 hypothetical protein N7479_002889 [Penicillium vulpinum]